MVAVHETGLEVSPVGHPERAPIRVSIERIRRCPNQLGEEFYPPSRKRPTQNNKVKENKEDDSSTWSGRLRSHTGQGRPPAEAGEM